MVEQAKLASLVDAAIKEDWELVDDELPGMADDPQVVDWATKEGLYHADGNVRDLGASVLEKSSIPLEEAVIERLRVLMESDRNPYARYRSAFALYRNGDHSREVVNVIKTAATDADTKGIAEHYLAQLNG